MRPVRGTLLLPALLVACATAGDRRPAGELSRPSAVEASDPASGQALPRPAPGSAPADAPPSSAREDAEPAPGADDGLATRLAARAGTMLGHRAAFTQGGVRFGADCSGFVSWVYQAEGIPLRQLMARAAPYESSAVAAIYEAARAWGVVFGGGGEWPRPGDLVFFRDTYDRNRDGRFDDPFTHVGIVERVDDDGTVVFLHRGSHGVARGALSLARPSDHRDEDGRELNSIMRKGRSPKDGSTLAGRLFMGYARFDRARLPAEQIAAR